MTDHPHELDLPFEKIPGGPVLGIDFTDAHIAGGMTLAAALIPDDDGRMVPALIYRFAKPDGSGFYPPMILVLPAESAIAAALEAVNAQ